VTGLRENASEPASTFAAKQAAVRTQHHQPNGFDDDDLISENTQDESDALARAYEASESSYELNFDDADEEDLNDE